MYLQKVKFALTTFLVLLALFSVAILIRPIVTLPLHQARYVAVAAIVVAVLGGYYLVYRIQAW